MPNQRLMDFAFLTGSLLEKSKLDTTALNKKLASRMQVLKVLNFSEKHGSQVSYAGNGRFTFREFGTDFVLKIQDIDLLDLYFSAKESGEIRFFGCDSNFFAKIGNLTFLIPFPNGVCELTEVFLHNDYPAMSVKNGVVVDVGAFIGDTAVYFASLGAKKVLAFEPALSNFKIARENVNLNHFEQIIDVRNLAVGDKEGWAEFAFVSDWPGRSSMALPSVLKSSERCLVKTTTLSRIIEELDHVDLLKMDCEGAEFQILPNALKEGNLGKISSLAVEVHGPPQEILKTLKAAQFKVTKHIIFPSRAHVISATRKSV